MQPDTAQQLAWNRRVVDYARAAADPRAQRWDAVALNNMGVALNDARRHDEALAVLQEALAAFERLGRRGSILVARWMVAHTQRLLGSIDEALAGQLALERDHAAAGTSDR